MSRSVRITAYAHTYSGMWYGDSAAPFRAQDNPLATYAGGGAGQFETGVYHIWFYATVQMISETKYHGILSYLLPFSRDQ